MVLLAFVSCQKDPANAEPSNCRPVTAYSYDSGSISDSARYEYDNNRLTKLYFNNDGYLLFDYSGERVSKRTWYDTGNPQPISYDLFFYNADGTVAKRESYFDAGLGNTKVDSVLFLYANGRLSEIHNYSLALLSSASLALSEKYEFTYSGNNVSKLVVRQYTDGNPGDVETYTFVYDNRPNYFRKQSPQFFQTDPVFFDADYEFLVLNLSENNVIKAGEISTPSDFLTFSYAADDKGNMTEIKADGEPLARYVYECR